MNIKKPSPDTMKEQAVRQAKDLLITVLILTAATGIGNIFWYFSFTKISYRCIFWGTLLDLAFYQKLFLRLFKLVFQRASFQVFALQSPA